MDDGTRDLPNDDTISGDDVMAGTAANRLSGKFDGNQ